ncbi:MAG: cobalt chelatase [Burkholderiaceae bacterium]
MLQGAAAARRQQRIEELCAAALRALAGERDLHYRGARVHRGRRPLPIDAPHLHPRVDDDDFASFRGAADGIAQRLRLADAALHQRLRPAGPIARAVFEMLEQFRVESLADPALPGLAHNLRHRFAQWSLAFHRTGLTDTDRGLLLYTVAQIARSRVSGEPVLEETEDLMETTRGALVPVIGTALAGLRRTRHDQAAYAVHAREIAECVARMIAATAGGDEDAAAQEIDDEGTAAVAFRFLMQNAPPPADAPAMATSGRGRSFDAATDGYRVFTSAYDRELMPAQMARPERLRELRAMLDARIAESGVHLARLARELRALLAEPLREAWRDAEEEGRIDGRRLAQLVASPAERRLFRREHLEHEADAMLAFLIDCSGSMREHAGAIAALVDTAARALEGVGVACEILGFTTGAWHGGRALRDWQRAGRPPSPGRLNERCHLVFKSADTRWRRARPGVAALLEGTLFREGLDGEAVDWACTRLLARAERRKVLVVISDGCPMDGATAQASGAHYLDAHLREVVARREQQGRVRVGALGVGLDLSDFYSRAQAVDLGAMRLPQLHRELLSLLGQRAHR